MKHEERRIFSIKWRVVLTCKWVFTGIDGSKENGATSGFQEDFSKE